MYSKTALIIYAAKREKIIKSNAHFWREFNNPEQLNKLNVNTEAYENHINQKGISLTCAFDKEFPIAPVKLKPSEKPCLFAYKGDITLLKDRTKNIAVIGTLTPTADILKRESAIVKSIVSLGYNVISGLAQGCDTAAHTECLVNKGKTIAFLPSDLNNIYPRKNSALARDIVNNGGLVITEYLDEPINRFQGTARFIARDRLQAMYAANIILIASNLPGQGDSGSRHAMAKAAEYNTRRFVMYNESTDKNNPLFGLNEYYAEKGTQILTLNTLKNLKR